jgi:hypothetical protein
MIIRHEAISTYASNPITFSTHGHIGRIPEQVIMIPRFPEFVEDVSVEMVLLRKGRARRRLYP